jgi:alpha-tubulin suppressor-like RCC1 family protein
MAVLVSSVLVVGLAGVGTAESATSAAAAAGGSYVSVPPSRVLDTRYGTGATKGAVTAGRTLALQIDGRGGVPVSGVSAVVLNVTVTQPTATGVVTLHADGTSLPLASNLNYVTGQTVPNLVIAPVGANGKVDLHVAGAGTVQLIADVSGYYTSGVPTAPGSFGSLPPSRVLDTRSGNGAPKGAMTAGRTLALQIDGRGGVPVSGVSAVVLNVTVTQPTAGGVVTLHADGTSLPLASNLNYVTGQTVPNLVIAAVGANGKVALHVAGAGTVQLIADVSGYYTTDAPTAPGSFGSLPPSRVLDTRSGNGAPKGAMTAGRTLALQINGRGRVPVSGISAVVLNVTVTQPTAGGVVTLHADGTSLPLASNLNYVTGQTVPNLVIAPVGANGKVDLHVAGTGTVQLIADVSGYVLKNDISSLWEWGLNTTVPDAGSLIYHAIPLQYSPMAGSTQIAAGQNVAYALRPDGTEWAWGVGDHGQLGNGQDTAAQPTWQQTQVSGLTQIAAIGSGLYNGYAVRADGTAWAWGANLQGQLGNNQTVASSTPVQVQGLTGITAITGGWTGGYALRADGTVWAWGANSLGQLGDGTLTNSLVPVQVSGLSGVTAIAAGGHSGYALRADGTVWAWGANAQGQLGNGTTASTGCRCSELPAQVTALSGITAIGGGVYEGYAAGSDGTAWAWGLNDLGELGNGTTTNSAVPVHVAGITGTTAIAGGYNTAYALSSGGTVSAWGSGGNGQLGNGTITGSLVPVPVSGLTGITAIVASYDTSGYALHKPL